MDKILVLGFANKVMGYHFYFRGVQSHSNLKILKGQLGEFFDLNLGLLRKGEKGDGMGRLARNMPKYGVKSNATSMPVYGVAELIHECQKTDTITYFRLF